MTPSGVIGTVAHHPLAVYGPVRAVVVFAKKESLVPPKQTRGLRQKGEPGSSGPNQRN